MAARLALWEPQDDDGGHRRSVYMGASRPLWSPFIFNPPIVPPSRGDGGGREHSPRTPPQWLELVYGGVACIALVEVPYLIS